MVSGIVYDRINKLKPGVLALFDPDRTPIKEAGELTKFVCDKGVKGMSKKMVANPKRVDREWENKHGQPVKESHTKDSVLSLFYNLFHKNKGVAPKLPKIKVTS